jgi:murein DD-endopeptidase MepM/ murein hydrolase activator NlpD
MAGKSRKAPFLRQIGCVAALIALGLAAMIQPASSDKARPGSQPESAALPPSFDAAPDLDAALPPDIVITRKVRKGDTLASILVRAGADKNDTQSVINALKKVHDPRGLTVGDEITLTFERLERYQTGRLLSIDLPAGSDHLVRAQRVDDDTFKVTKNKKSLAQTLVRAAATIDSSLYVSANRAGLPPELVAELVRIFSFDVDFQRDVQPGDKFEVLYQRLTDEDGSFVRLGDILYASLTLSGQRRQVYRYRGAEGAADYYDAKGENIRKVLLRTPLDAAKVSSSFGNRHHPILGYTRMHRGVDFAAPAGTPVYAAGAGTVVFRGTQAGYGNYVRIHHDKQYDSAYGHLSRFAKGLRVGDKVRQGQVIGYVGSTGLATGPHLHYELLANNQQVNPLGVKFAGGRALTGREKVDFAQVRANIERWLAALPATTTVSRR